jgi:hypothetical protein
MDQIDQIAGMRDGPYNFQRRITLQRVREQLGMNARVVDHKNANGLLSAV